MYKEPIKYYSIEPIIVLEEEDEILGQDCPAVSLKETMQNIMYKRFATKQDYSLAMNNPTNWFNGDNKWYGFMAIGTILAVLFIPVVIFVLVKFFGLKFQFDKTSATITKLLTMVKLIPPEKAECYMDVSDTKEVTIPLEVKSEDKVTKTPEEQEVINSDSLDLDKFEDEDDKKPDWKLMFTEKPRKRNPNLPVISLTCPRSHILRNGIPVMLFHWLLQTDGNF